ncbi:methyltransferase [Brachybacterium sp. FME24]|uniref:methyltransferase n=1 Tax=Brachybacterium sp. FME24 TaxID=2742605 RepID=UPI001867651F|nr:methyltransferase [Brachybacterium sp. FME24]
MSQITHELVLEVLDGCGASALREAGRLGTVRQVTPTELSLTTDDLDAVRDLRRVVAASISLTVVARRPRELLETSVQQRFAGLLEDLDRQRPRQRFQGLRLEAAGAETPDMRRLAEALAQHAGLEVDAEGDLVVRVRRGAPAHTWEMLLRTTPRPLSTRAWRTVDYPGAVNATIAATVLDQLEVSAKDTVLDMTCGSGTFLVEQLHEVAPARSVGVDREPAAIDAAEQHQRAARRKGRVDWITGDVLSTAIEPGFTRIVTNPPWGTLHGEHESNEQLLADLLDRAAELAAPHARLGVLTHEITRMHRVLERPGSTWRLLGEHRFFQKGHHPRLFLFDRG